MSAVVELPAAQQPSTQQRQHIAGITTLHLACMGVLRHDAGVRMVGAPGHEVVLLEVWCDQQIDHHPHALPLFAAWQLPDTGGLANTVQWARHLASTMRAGTDVVVAGTGLETGKRAGEQVLRVIKPTGIRTTGAVERELERPAAQQEQQHHVQPA